MDPQVLAQVQTAACVHANYIRCIHTHTHTHGVIMKVLIIIETDQICKIYIKSRLYFFFQTKLF